MLSFSIAFSECASGIAEIREGDTPTAADPRTRFLIAFLLEVAIVQELEAGKVGDLYGKTKLEAGVNPTGEKPGIETARRPDALLWRIPGTRLGPNRGRRC